MGIKERIQRHRAEKRYGDDARHAEDPRRYYGGPGNGVDADHAAKLDKKPEAPQPKSGTRPHRPAA